MSGVSKRISVLLGTRPEAIKLCPLVTALRSHRHFEPHVCVTGQHLEMLTQVLETFDVKADVDLRLMRQDQTLGGLTSRAIAAIDGYMQQYRPDMVMVQGDTTTTFCAALCAFYHKIPVAHVEAGLRTWNAHSPFPEEMNRVLVSHLADLHCAPTERAKQNLLREHVPESRIIVSGNTVIDALMVAVEKVKVEPPEIPGLPHHVMNGKSDVPLVLITGHRRENFGSGFESICRAVKELSQRFPATQFVYPVHLNPNVHKPVHRLLGACPNIHLLEPLGYLPFVAVMSRAKLVLTDSGGVQEEAPCLGKPVLVMRDTTERPEAVDMGVVRLVGIDRVISAGLQNLLGAAAVGTNAPARVPSAPRAKRGALATSRQSESRGLVSETAVCRRDGGVDIGPTAPNRTANSGQAACGRTAQLPRRIVTFHGPGRPPIAKHDRGSTPSDYASAFTVAMGGEAAFCRR